MIKNIILFFALTSCVHGIAQKKAASTDVYVNKNGVMRWPGTNKEVEGFGINYTVPFAYGFRSAKALGVDLEKAIDLDVYHFARLGFDAFRVHVWDTEISDTAGNLLENEHLRLFDYLLYKMQQRGMKFLITPIAYWGNGWPAPDEETPGFSYKYGKDKCLTDTNAIRAQQNYLYQFLNHVNPYTGIAYKHEPGIVAFEISNEPHHGEAPEKVTAFISGMIKSMRKTGCKKPIFYNISHKINLAQAYFNAGINGGTFQWYPTGLGFKQELKGNMLPNVDAYHIPFANDPGFKKIAKVVYEFDAADVGRSYIYPAMARSFRTAGIQWATHFAYDPSYTAYANTEYDTHFMNLLYAPQKALSLMIAGEVFHHVPMYKNYGTYPADTSFDGFRVSYREDMAEMVTPEKFIYTNNTVTKPDDAGLTLIAGSGSSGLVQYNGTGAYFLDKLQDGAWRLEVMPDAVWVSDPFGRNSLKKTNAVVNSRENSMHINLKNIGEDFIITAYNIGNKYTAAAQNGSFKIQPGTYVLQSKFKAALFNGNEVNGHIKLNEYGGKQAGVNKTYVVHQPLKESRAGNDLKIDAVVISPAQIQLVQLYVTGGYRPQFIPMKERTAYHFTAVIPSTIVSSGLLHYYIVVKQNDSTFTYPSGVYGSPQDWDFYDNTSYTTMVANPAAPIYIFDAFSDAGSVVKKWNRASSVTAGDAPNTLWMNTNVGHLYEPDNENPSAQKIIDYTMRFYCADRLAGAATDEKKYLVLRGHALNKKACIVQMALVTKDGVSFGATANIDTTHGDYRVALADLKLVKTVLMPRPYPSFLAYYFTHSQNYFNLKNVEALQFSVGPGIDPLALGESHGFSVESVRLE